MAYSMFERPKLHNAKSLRFYPEQYDHHVSFRHKNLPPDFDMSVQNYAPPKIKSDKSEKRNPSLQAHPSTYKKCPIYVHSIPEINQTDGDFVKSRKKSKSKQKSALEKLEETYWANWKPDKTGLKKSKSPPVPSTKTKVPQIQVIKSAPERARKIRLYPESENEIVTQIQSKEKIKTITSKSAEIQTDDVLVSIAEEPKPAPPPIEEILEVNVSEEVLPDIKFLKHTDSFILIVKKQKEEKERLDQPKCIRLYKKPGKMSKNFTKGGSYPLKSCLKTESSFNRSAKPPRPKSPLISSSNFSSKAKYTKPLHRR